VSNVTPEQVLACPMDPKDNEAGVSSVREYLVALLRELWTNKDTFSGKRPFGMSYWQGELYWALVQAGLVSAEFDEDGDLVRLDSDTADQLVADAIQHLGLSCQGDRTTVQGLPL